MANKPTVAWAETTPAGNSIINLGDNRLREMKEQLREVFGADHIFESSGQGDTWGYHNRLTLIEQAENPTAITDTGILFTKEVGGKSELHFIDAESNVMQLTSGGHFTGGITNEVRMWSGLLADIPEGWALCDGNDDRPDLIGKFIQSIPNSTTEALSEGGEDSTEAVLPSHTHIQSSADGTHQHPIYLFTGSGSYSNPKAINSTSLIYTLGFGVTSYDTTDSHTTSHTHGTSEVGGDTSFENRPAYLELAFIVRT